MYAFHAHKIIKMHTFQFYVFIYFVRTPTFLKEKKTNFFGLKLSVLFCCSFFFCCNMPEKHRNQVQLFWCFNHIFYVLPRRFSFFFFCEKIERENVIFFRWVGSAALYVHIWMSMQCSYFVVGRWVSFQR